MDPMRPCWFSYSYFRPVKNNQSRIRKRTVYKPWKSPGRSMPVPSTHPLRPELVITAQLRPMRLLESHEHQVG